MANILSHSSFYAGKAYEQNQGGYGRIYFSLEVNKFVQKFCESKAHNKKTWLKKNIIINLRLIVDVNILIILIYNW